jgi:hypothetical protein
MLTRVWREGAFLHGRKRFRHGIISVIETAATVTALMGIALSPMRADNMAAGTDQVDTEHVFGFNEGADIGSKGEQELIFDSTLRASRSTGAFADMASQFEFGYTVFQNIRISAAATLGYYDINGVTGIEDARRAAIQSLSFDARFRLLDRSQAPFGLTLSAAPHWGLVDETSGVRTNHFGAEIKILADRALTPDLLVGTVNLLFADDRARLLARARIPLGCRDSACSADHAQRLAWR